MWVVFQLGGVGLGDKAEKPSDVFEKELCNRNSASTNADLDAVFH